MANGHGGYRKPGHPAPVSGPGKYARRTDGGPAQVQSAAPNQDYGEAKQQINAQRIAPMAGKEPLPKASSLPSGGEAPQTLPTFTGTDLTAPSQRPNEPITTGVDIGEGAGPEILGLPNPAQGTGQMTALLQRYANVTGNGQLAILLQKAQARNA
jgi:hypothetical protein